MRILYNYPEISTPMHQWQRIHFIDELSRLGVEFDIFNPLIFDNFEMAQEELVKKVRKGKYDLFFASACCPTHLKPEVLKEIKRLGIPTLCFRPDNLKWPFADKEMSPLYDLVWLTAKETQYLYDEWGAKTIFAPYAANPFVFKYNPREIIRKACFIGSPHGTRPLVINALTQGGVLVDAFYGKDPTKFEEIKKESIAIKYILPQTQSRLQFYMNNLRHAEGRKLFISGIMSKLKGEIPVDRNENLSKQFRLSFDEMATAYGEYALALSFTTQNFTYLLKEPLPVVNLRAFEVAMCGGIQICRYNEELNNYFEEGQEIFMYKTHEELVDKAKYVLNKISDGELQKMKSSARKRAEQEHTWQRRFELVLHELGLTL